MSAGLVLSLFPGADLFGRAFEAAGFCVVRGPDLLWGSDVRAFHAARGKFDGIIGGPPYQIFSLARHGAKKPAVNLIPEFLRVVDEASPSWTIMENVRTAQRAAPAWPWADLCDWDCGGRTHRLRRFWFLGIPPPLVGCPVPNPRDLAGAEYSVLASDWKRNSSLKHVDDAARRQGFPELGRAIIDGQPGDKRAPVAARSLAIHMLGNGVPRAMGDYLVRHVLRCTQRGSSPAGELPPAEPSPADRPRGDQGNGRRGSSEW